MFWMNYFNMEKGVYEQLLANPDEEVKGTVEELANKYELELNYLFHVKQYQQKPYQHE